MCALYSIIIRELNEDNDDDEENEYDVDND